MSDKRVVADKMGFGPPGRGHLMGGAQRAADSRAAVRRLWAYLGPHRKGLIIGSIMVAITTGLTLVTPYLTGLAIDEYILRHDLPGLARIALIMVVVSALAAVGTQAQTVIMIKVSQRTIRDIRRDLFSRLQALPLRFFDKHPHGELMSRLTNDTETITNALGETVAQLVSAVLSLVGAGGAMIWLNWRLAIVSLLTLPAVVLFTRTIAGHTRQGFRDRQSSLGTLNGIIEETITGQRVVKVCGREQQAIESFDTANDRLRRTATRAWIVVGLMGPIMGLMRNVDFAIISGVGGWMVVKDLATVGTVIAFINYARNFTRPIHEIANLYGTIQSAFAGAERVFAVIDEQPEPADADDALALVKPKGEVVFDHVDFGYVPDVPVLQDVTFTAAPGKTIALVGPTGAGKTTIINLLTRFYDIDAGKITIDGHDIRHIKRDTLRRSLGIVLQDMVLFADTVRENIRYGRLDATDEEIEQAARLANADAFIRHLPHGYETPLTDVGSSLSQGQRQLLAIARAVLADPEILILDEATSSVDTRTELHIQEAMLRLMEGRTSFVIAHRLSTIRKADCILVIDDGRIVERGTHAELLRQEGLYFRMHNAHLAALSGAEVTVAVPEGAPE